MSSLFLSVLRSKAWVWWIPTTVYTSNQALILNDRLHGCLLCIPMRNWSAACRRLKGCETLWLTQTCHPASKTTIQHSSARKHDVFYEAGLGSQVFLEATFSERKQVGLCEGRKKKKKDRVSTKVVFPTLMPTLASCLAMQPVTYGACNWHDDLCECHYWA